MSLEIAGRRVTIEKCWRHKAAGHGDSLQPLLCETGREEQAFLCARELGTAERTVSACHYSTQWDACMARTLIANWYVSLYLYSLDIADSSYFYLFKVFNEI